MTTASEILDELDMAADETDEVSLGRISDHVGHRGTGALLAIPGALELTPIGGVPGVPSLLAMVAAIFAAQILLGREDMWLPHVLGQRTIRASRLRTAVAKLRRPARWSDRHLGGHLEILTVGPAPRMAALAILLLCLTVPVLELVPFASSIPMSTTMLFGIGLLLRDGRVIALAWIAFLAAIFGVWSIWPSDWPLVDG